jgi:voltage-gated potassium channel
MTLLRKRLFAQLDSTARVEPGLSLANKVVGAAIILSVLAAIAESEPLLARGREDLLGAIELGFGALFLIEYIARVWVCVDNPAYGPGLLGRLRYARSAPAVLDLLALTPLVLTAVGTEAYILRLVRLLRLIRLARIGRFSIALTALRDAVKSRQFELIASVCVALLLLLITSSVMYMVEGEAQPEAFGSIPRAMWWSVATLTTVGYGDAVPITAPGKVLAGVTAVAGIGLIAMPTGILAAAFSDAMQRHRQDTGH